MVRLRWPIFIVGLIFIGIGTYGILTNNPWSNYINVLFGAAGLVISFTQLFFTFPIINSQLPSNRNQSLSRSRPPSASTHSSSQPRVLPPTSISRAQAPVRVLIAVLVTGVGIGAYEILATLRYWEDQQRVTIFWLCGILTFLSVIFCFVKERTGIAITGAFFGVTSSVFGVMMLLNGFELQVENYPLSPDYFIMGGVALFIGFLFFYRSTLPVVREYASIIIAAFGVLMGFSTFQSAFNGDGYEHTNYGLFWISVILISLSIITFILTRLTRNTKAEMTYQFFRDHDLK